MIASVSETNGISQLQHDDLMVYSVGISTGGIAEMRMAMSHPNRQIIATTIDPIGIEFARKKVEEAGLCNQIDVKMEDISKPLPYPNNHFDFIYARLVLHYLPISDLNRALKELHRVLKNHGRIFVVVRSAECLEAREKNSSFDPQSHLTTYTSDGLSYSRYFHSKESIQNHLLSAGFRMRYIKSYQEQLCIDFERVQPSKQVDALIEVLAEKFRDC